MEPTRRRYLAATVGVFSLAGCQMLSEGGDESGGNGDSNPDDGGTGGTATDGNGTPTSGTDAATPTETSDGSAGTTTPNGAGNDDEPGATVGVTTHDEYGRILADRDGNVLYMFDSDTQGSQESACTGGCLSSWPPLTTDGGEASPSHGVTASISTFERADGDVQVTANGWPLYYYQGDGESGEATGQGVGDVWWVLDPDGEPIR